MMFRVALVLAICSVGCNAGLFSRNNGFQKEYDQLNEHLIQSVQTDDVEPNMAAATQWVSTLKGSQLTAVRQFLELQNVVGPHKCDNATMELLQANFAAIGEEKHKWNAEVVRRVDKMVRHFALEHAKVCRQAYRKLVTQKLTQMGAQQSKCISTLMELTTKSFQKDSWSMVKDAWRDGYTTCPIHPIGENYMLKNHLMAHRALKQLAAADPDRKYFFEKTEDESTGTSGYNVEKISELFDKYIYQPCYNMDTKIARIFLPAMKYDLDILNLREQCEDVLIERVALGMCHHVVQNKDSIKAEVMKEITSGMYFIGDEKLH